MNVELMKKLGFSTFLSNQENKKTAEQIIETSKQVASSNASTSSQSQSQVKEIRDSSGNVIGYEDANLQMSYFKGREPTTVTQEQNIQETKTIAGKVSGDKVYVTETGLHGKTITVTYQVQKPSEEELKEQAYKHYQEQINQLQQQGYRVVQATQGVEFIRVSQPTAVVPFFEDYFNQIKQQNSMQESFTKTYEIVYSKELPKGEDIAFDVTFEKTITQKYFRNPFDIKVVGETGMQSVEAKGFNAMLLNTKKQQDISDMKFYFENPNVIPKNVDIEKIQSEQIKSLLKSGTATTKANILFGSAMSYENPLLIRSGIAAITKTENVSDVIAKGYIQSVELSSQKPITFALTNPISTLGITLIAAPYIASASAPVKIAAGGAGAYSVTKSIYQDIKEKDYIGVATTVAYTTVLASAATISTKLATKTNTIDVNKVYSKDMIISKTENEIFVGQKAISKSVYDTAAGVAKVKTQYITISAKDNLKIGEVNTEIAKVPGIYLSEGQSATIFKSTITLNKHQQTILGITKAMQTSENEAIYTTLAKTAKTNYYVAVGQAKSTQLLPETVDIKSQGIKIATHTAPRTLVTQVETIFNKNTKTSNLITNIVYDMTTKASNNKNFITSASKSSSSVQQIVTIPETAIKSVMTQLQKTQVKTNIVPTVFVLAKTVQEAKQEQALKTNTVTVTKQVTSNEYLQDLKTTVTTKVLDKTIEKTTQINANKLNYSLIEKTDNITKNNIHSRITTQNTISQEQKASIQNINVKNVNVLKNLQQQTIPKINFNANFSFGGMFNTLKAKILQNKQNYAVPQVINYPKISGKMPEINKNYKIGFLADLLSVSYSQFKFGKATHTMSKKAYNIAKSTNFIRIPTRELLKVTK